MIKCAPPGKRRTIVSGPARRRGLTIRPDCCRFIRRCLPPLCYELHDFHTRPVAAGDDFLPRGNGLDVSGFLVYAEPEDAVALADQRHVLFVIGEKNALAVGPA